MTDILLENGCPVRDSKGNYVRLGDLDARFQRAVIAMTVRHGTFIYNRSLGVDYDAFSHDEADAVGRLDMLIKEATADIGGVRTEVVAFDEDTMTIDIKVTYNGSSAVTEVDISGII